MPSQEIDDFTALTAPASGDLIPLVDVSDTTDSAQGTTKKITRDDLLGLFVHSISSNASAVADDDIVFIDTSGGAVTLTLMTASGRKRPLRIKNISSSGNDATIDGAGSETIDGSLTYTLIDGDSIQIIPRTTSAWETYK